MAEREPVVRRLNVEYYDGEMLRTVEVPYGKFCDADDAWAKLVLLAKLADLYFHPRPVMQSRLSSQREFEEAAGLCDRILSAAPQPPTTRKEGE